MEKNISSLKNPEEISDTENNISASKPEIINQVITLSRPMKDYPTGWVKWIFLILSFSGGWLFTQEYLVHYSGFYILIFWALFLIVTLWFLSRKRKVNLKNPMFIVSAAALLIISGRTIFYAAPEFKSPMFPVLPFLGVFTVLMAIEEYDGFSLNPFIDSIASVLLSPLTTLFQVPDFISNRKKTIDSGDNTNKTLFNKDILIGLLIGLPLVFVLYNLLVSGDSIFMDAANSFFEFLKIDLDRDFKIFLIRIAMSLVAMVYYLSLSLALLSKKKSDKANTVNPRKLGSISPVTANTILTVVNILFLIYTIVQISAYFSFSTFTGTQTASMISDFGRSGFFSLLQVMGINLALLTFLKRNTKKTENSSPVTAALYSFTWLFTGGLTILSYLRMVTYESEYGYTYLRIGVKFALVFIFIALIGFLLYFINSEFKLIKFCTISILILVTIMSTLNIDAIIVKKAGEIYSTKGRLDTEFLSKLSTDAYPVLTETFHFNGQMTEDEKELKRQAYYTLENLKTYVFRDDFLSTTFNEKELIEKIKTGNLLVKP